MNPEEFAAALREHNVELNAQQLAQYQQYYERLVAVNEHMNLTAITERDEVYMKHFYDSLTLAWAYPALQTEELHMIDVGAGAGFPFLTRFGQGIGLGRCHGRTRPCRRVW